MEKKSNQTTESSILTNQELQSAWEFVEHTGRSIFLTGKAGTGKTTFLKRVVEQSKKRLIVVAPTGVAAINAGGVTIHSFFQLPFTPFIPNSQIKSKFDFGKEKRRIIASLDLLIIDEISMVRSDLLDAIDSVLRRYRDRYQPFGGVQLMMVGDLQQLTPVVTPEEETLLSQYYDTPYFFGSKQLQQTDYVTIQLERVRRSAAYFEKTLAELYTRPLELAAGIQSNNKQAMKRYGEALPELRQAVLSRRYLLTSISQKGFTISTYLHEKQFSLLEAIDEGQIKKARRQRENKPKAQKEPKQKTWEVSYQLYRDGMKPEEIAKMRSFTIGTIYNHLAHYVKSGDIPLSELIPAQHQEAILKVVGRIGLEQGRTAIKSLCPPDITFEEINLVLGTMEP